MRGYRFFEEFMNEQREQSAGNVIAVPLGDGPFVGEGTVLLHAVGAADPAKKKNASVAPSIFEAEYLGTRCRHVTEAHARNVHPRLFEYLDTLA